jgi:antitoxin component of MazEF toxin-antitoxin module
MKAGSYFRFRARTSSNELSVEFIPKLLARPGEHSIMITIPPSVVEAAGLVNASEVTLELLGPTTAREAAKAAGKEREFAESLKPRQSKRTVEKIRAVPLAKTDVPKLPVSEAPVRKGSVKVPEESQVLPKPKPEDIAVPLLASSVPLPSTRGITEEEKTGSLPKPPVTVVPEAPVRTTVVRKRTVERHEVPDDAMKRVEDALLSMKRKIVYVYLAPQVILGQLKTRQEIDEASNELMR